MRLLGLLLTYSAFAASVDYSSQVEPLLRAKCYGCHGPAQQLSGLRLDQKQAAFAGGYSGPAIVPGKSPESKLIARISGAKGVLAMPPGTKGLPPAEIALLKGWIDEGAAWASVS